MTEEDRVTEYARNTYDDEDMKAILTEIEDHESEIEKIMASAMGKAAGIRKKIKAVKKRAKDDLAIPMGVLVPLLKVRKLDRQRKKIEDDVSEELIEVYVDAAGQFSMFAPVHTEGDHEVEPEKPWPDDEAAKSRDAAEQAEGEKVLEGAVH
jgi:hypothetical protein